MGKLGVIDKIVGRTYSKPLLLLALNYFENF